MTWSRADGVTRPQPQELRASNKIDTSDLKLEHSLFRSFDDIVRRQLDSVWHTVSYKTKQVLRQGPMPGLLTHQGAGEGLRQGLLHERPELRPVLPGSRHCVSALNP